MAWTPKNWKNPYTLPLPCADSGSFVITTPKDAFEVGANAMLKAIVDRPQDNPDLCQWAEEYCRDLGYKEPA